MTASGARTAANLILGVAGVAAAYVIWTTPPLRRTVFKAARLWLGASVPAFLVNEAYRAWVESGRPA